MDTESLRFLRLTVSLARQGLFTASPNPRVGALIVSKGRIIGQGYHHKSGSSHAEVAAIKAAENVKHSAATMYVSLEPCCHQGKTPPCVQAVIHAGINKVVIAMLDPNPLVAGKGVEALRRAGIEVVVHPLIEAYELNAGFYLRMAQNRPFIRLKVAASLDGGTALADGQSKWITQEEARGSVQYWRARSCAILTGIGTVLADDPQLTVRHPSFSDKQSVRPTVRVIVDRLLKTPPNAKLFESSAPIWIATTQRSYEGNPEKVGLLKRKGVQHFLVCAEAAEENVDDQAARQVFITDVLQKLASQGINELWVEAGHTLLGQFIQYGLFDELHTYVAPKLLGVNVMPLASFSIESLPCAVQLKCSQVHYVGIDTHTIWRPQSDKWLPKDLVS